MRGIHVEDVNCDDNYNGNDNDGNAGKINVPAGPLQNLALQLGYNLVQTVRDLLH
jgi:hypothetical protein